MSKQKFQIGDKVIVKVNPFKGMTATVLEVEHGACSGRIMYTVVFDDCQSFAFYSYELEKVEKFQSEFKIGDYVETAAGHKGVISSLSNTTAMIIENGKSLLVDLIHIKKKIERSQNTNNMKNERMVKLTLEKAKEWYKKGGELKEVALQVFKEEELKENTKPRSWEEYVNNYTINGKEHYIGSNSTIYEMNPACIGRKFAGASVSKNWMNTKELAEAFLAMMQLMSLRQAWIGDWKPDWKDDSTTKWCITVQEYKIKVDYFYVCCFPLSFPTRVMAQEFLDCFSDLLEKTKGLY